MKRKRRSNFEKVVEDFPLKSLFPPEVLIDAEIQFGKWLDKNKNNNPEIKAMADFLAREEDKDARLPG